MEGKRTQERQEVEKGNQREREIKEKSKQADRKGKQEKNTEGMNKGKYWKWQNKVNH